MSTSGAVFLSAHDYSNRYKTGINIAQPLLDTIHMIGPYNVIQVITDNAANCKEAGAIIEDKYPVISQTDILWFFATKLLFIHSMLCKKLNKKCMQNCRVKWP